MKILLNLWGDLIFLKHLKTEQCGEGNPIFCIHNYLKKVLKDNRHNENTLDTPAVDIVKQHEKEAEVDILKEQNNDLKTQC